MANGGIRGIHDIPTNGSVARTGPNGAQNAHRLARMRHQKALLEKQLAVGTVKKATTDRRLQKLEQEIEEVLSLFDRNAGSARPQAMRRSPGMHRLPRARGRKEVALEF